MTTPNHPPIILFDGVCNLCSRSVQYVIARDPQQRFRFASLQSEIGRALLSAYRPDSSIDTVDLGSVILIQNGTLHQKSSAALRVAAQLRGPSCLLAAFLILPPFIRDWGYDMIGQRRYRWFGKTEQCWLPKPEFAERFLKEIPSKALPTYHKE